MLIFLYMGIWANVFWNILNLAPVYPLDGGQAALRELFMRFNYRERTQIQPDRERDCCSAYLNCDALESRAASHFMAFFFGYMAYSTITKCSMSVYGGYGGGRPW